MVYILIYWLIAQHQVPTTGNVVFEDQASCLAALAQIDKVTLDVEAYGLCVPAGSVQVAPAPVTTPAPSAPTTVTIGGVTFSPPPSAPVQATAPKRSP